MQSRAKDGSTSVEVKASRDPISTVLFAEEGKLAWSGGKEGVLRRWQVEDGRELGQPIRVERAAIYTAALSPDGKRLVCALGPTGDNDEFDSDDDGDGDDDEDVIVRVWDAQTYEKLLDVKGHTEMIGSVDISPDSTRFATGSDDDTARIWSLTTGDGLLGPLRHSNDVIAVRFSPDGDRLATATSGESIRIYDVENGQKLLDFPFNFSSDLSSPLAWSADGRELFAVSRGEVECFDAASGSSLGEWNYPDSGTPTSIVLSRSQNFAVIAADETLSFWDISKQIPIGDVIEHSSTVMWIALSPNDGCLATGEENGKVTFRTLYDILPDSCFTVDLSCMYLSHAAFRSWSQGNLAEVEELLTKELTNPWNPSHHARTLAQRALVRIRYKQWKLAMDDAERSIKTQRSVIGRIATAIATARAGEGEHKSAMRAFDLVFSDGLARENKFLLLIKAIILFECGKHDNAILRVDRLADTAMDRSIFITVRAQMCLILGSISMKKGDSKRATALLDRVQEAIPVQHGPHLQAISLVFGWDFDKLATASPDLVQKCLSYENKGDAALTSNNPQEAIAQYSAALSLNPWQSAGLFVKRSTAQATLLSWKDALKDADEAIKAEPASPDGYERRHAALHALQRYDEALTAFARMLSLIEDSSDPEIRQQGQKYVSPSRSKSAINNVIEGVLKVSPLALIDVKSGRLCSRNERTDTFKSEPEFNELVSSMTNKLDNNRIRQAVENYFHYVTLSHVWGGKEPSFQEVNEAGSIWNLDSSSPLNDKLHKFCEMVRMDGYRWAWSDTVCIDKTISTVLNQSLKMMYMWYEASAATFVFLVDVESLPAPGGLKKSRWMTRAWTSQELLSPKIVRFYTKHWKPYLGDTRPNHKDSPAIMKELADAISIAHETIVSFSPDALSTREKLRLASTRNATVEEDVAYSLIGIFKSDIRPEYGEGYAALGHLLEETVARSGEVTVLDWIGKSSPYNSCLPSTLAVYSRPPHTPPAITEAEMDERVTALKDSLSETDAKKIYDKIIGLPYAKFANRRLYLPCLIFTIRKLGLDGFGDGHENHYRARVSGVGNMEFHTSDRLQPKDARKLVLVHPWIRNLRDPLDGYTRRSALRFDEDEEDSDGASEIGSAPPSPLPVRPAALMDDYTRALRLVVRLQQPFHALLLQQQPDGEFRRVAADREIVVPGVEVGINLASDVCPDVVEIL